MRSSALKKGLSKAKKSARNANNGSDYNSYSESDEGVNDQNALFQRRDGPPKSKLPKGFKKTSNFGSGGMNDEEIDHTESDEGVNDGNANFDGNEFTFKKRKNDKAANKNSSQ